MGGELPWGALPHPRRRLEKCPCLRLQLWFTPQSWALGIKGVLLALGALPFFCIDALGEPWDLSKITRAGPSGSGPRWVGPWPFSLLTQQWLQPTEQNALGRGQRGKGEVIRESPGLAESPRFPPSCRYRGRGQQIHQTSLKNSRAAVSQ